jgi:hypothetical protein
MMSRRMKQIIGELSERAGFRFARARAGVDHWRAKSQGLVGAFSRYARGKTARFTQAARSRVAPIRGASSAHGVAGSHDFCKRACVAVDPDQPVID